MKDNPPTAEVKLIPPRRRGECYQWQVLSCPYCGCKHLHGAGGELEDLGHRVAHCLKQSPDNNGYMLVWAAADRKRRAAEIAGMEADAPCDAQGSNA